MTCFWITTTLLMLVQEPNFVCNVSTLANLTGDKVLEAWPDLNIAFLDDTCMWEWEGNSIYSNIDCDNCTPIVGLTNMTVSNLQCDANEGESLGGTGVVVLGICLGATVLLVILVCMYRNCRCCRKRDDIAAYRHLSVNH